MRAGSRGKGARLDQSLGQRRGGFPLSVNATLILVNVAVFLLGSSIRTSVPMDRGFEAAPGADLSGTLAMRNSYRVIHPDRGPVEVAPEALNRYRGPAQRLVLSTETGRVVGVVNYNFVDPIFAYGHFSTSKSFLHINYNGTAVQGLELWRFVTFQFVHGGFVHLALNMVGLLVFGSIIEQHLGRKKYLAFYLMCGICGSFLYLGLNLLGQIFGGLPLALPYHPSTPLVGASGGVFGVIVASARLMPKERIFIPIPPVVLPLGWVAGGYVGLSALNLLFGGANAGGDAAHLGGAIAGWFFIRHNYLLRDFFDVLKDSRDPPRKDLGGGKQGGSGATAIDAILEKIASKGEQSLTAQERATLKRETERRRRSRSEQ